MLRSRLERSERPEPVRALCDAKPVYRVHEEPQRVRGRARRVRDEHRTNESSISASSTAHTSSSFLDSADADTDGAYGGAFVSVAVAVKAAAKVAVEIPVPVQEGARVPVAAHAREGERVRGLCVCGYVIITD